MRAQLYSPKLFTVALALAALSAANATQSDTRVTVDGTMVSFADVQPMMTNNRVMVPVRGVFEHLNADVTWDARNQQVIAQRGTDTITLPVNSMTAMVNGSQVRLDTPAIVVRGRTMVPLRFLSESLKASVDWMSSSRTVAIWTNGGSNSNPDQNQGGNQNNQGYTTMVLDSGSVIPFRLNDELSSNRSEVGEKFTATLDATDYDNYQGLPNGSVLEGHVDVVRAKDDEAPGVLGLAFDRVRTPDGRYYSVDGTLIGLDNKSVNNENGRLTAKSGAKNDLKYVGYGAGAGALVALITKGNVVTTTLIGSAIGYLFGELDRQKARDVSLKTDSKFGVRLMDDLSFRVPTVATRP